MQNWTVFFKFLIKKIKSRNTISTLILPKCTKVEIKKITRRNIKCS